MSLSIKEIKAKWAREREHYKKQELGSGVHSFVRDFLESKDLFALKEGSLSTKPELRRNEYIHENKAKEQRQADFVIFIDPDILIPLEAERYGNIKAGVSQIFNYQQDFDKQYGILTDGYIWRFYNNNIYREYNLEQILDDSEVFLSFWKEYIKPESYYLSFFEPIGQLSLLRDTERIQVDKNRQIFFEDITKLIRNFKNKLQVEGYFKNLEKKEREKRAVEITYAYIIQFILYKTLVDNDFGVFGKEFNNNVKKIHEYIKNKRYKDVLGVIDGITAQISRNVYRPFADEQDFIRQKLLELYQSVENRLSDVSPWIDIFVFIKKYSFVNIENEIFGYIYENYLKELYEEGQKGQYFTDPAIVNFMLQQIGFVPQEVLERHKSDKNSISLVDPACGSGTFLYSAVNTIINTFGNHSEAKSKLIEEIVVNNIYGLDIAEFPLYLAEMSIIMRLLPMIITEKYNNPVDKKIKVFLTKDSVGEFIKSGIDNTEVDEHVRGGQLRLGLSMQEPDIESFMRDAADIKEMKASLNPRNGVPRQRYDFVIGNPPYIGYNESSKQGVLITQLIQKKIVQMSNIYGVNLNTVPGRIKAYAPKPNLYAFFIALGIALLKENGKLCYIIPQTILTANDLDVLRYHLSKYVTINRVITFSGKMFIGRGLRQNKPIPTSSLIFVLEKKLPSKTHETEIINYKSPDDDIEECLHRIANGKNVVKKKILQSRLLDNVGNWNFIKMDKETEQLFDVYNQKMTIDEYRLPELSKPRFNSVFYFDKGLVFPKDKIYPTADVSNQDYFHLVKADKRKYQLSLDGTAVLRSDIGFPGGSQGIDVYEKRYKIVWRYINTDRFYYTDKKIMVNFNWIVISSDNKEEIFYLLSLLNSRVNSFVLRSLLKSENEKDILIGIKSIKEFLRIPKITPENQIVKEEIISGTRELLAIEEKTLSQCVDFSKVMIQKLDSVELKNSELILKHGQTTTKLPIKMDGELVNNALEKLLDTQALKLETKRIGLSMLKDLPIIDTDKEQMLKSYIDDLFFALYFDIPIKKLGIKEHTSIRNGCSKSKFYKLLSDS